MLQNIWKHLHGLPRLIEEHHQSRETGNFVSCCDTFLHKIFPRISMFISQSAAYCWQWLCCALRVSICTFTNTKGLKTCMMGYMYRNKKNQNIKIPIVLYQSTIILKVITKISNICLSFFVIKCGLYWCYRLSLQLGNVDLDLLISIKISIVVVGKFALI